MSRRASRATRRAARKADKQARRHEGKLERAERRSLRARRRTATHTLDRPVEVVQPAEELIEARPAHVPDAVAQRIPAQADGPGIEQHEPADGAEPVSSRRQRRRRRRQQAARAIAVAVPAVDPEPTIDVAAEAAGTTVTARRTRSGRRRKVRSPAVAPLSDTLDDVSEVEAAVADPEVDPVVEPGGDPGAGRTPRPALTGGRPPSRSERRFAREIAKAVARGESGPPPAEPETLAQYVARVDSGLVPRRKRRSRPRTPRWLRRTARVTVVVAVVGACVALPWAVPSVPQAISDFLTDDSSPTGVADPKVAPPKDAFVGPVGVVQQAGPLLGVRLQAAGEPREVRVPRLHVDSDVVRISGQSGSLLPPSDPQLLGWWQEGRWPGAGSGTAVVTGHTVHTGGGALDQLDQLVVGDSLRVRTDNGWIRYVVQRTRIYSTEELARDAEQVFRLDGPGRLVLITCDDWNGSFYESNAVVFATPVEDQPTVSSTETAVPDPGIAGG